jgi:hypothetical protein
MTYCNWSIDVKGYYTDEKGNFTAIVPVWSSYSRYSNQRPVNHLKITGVVVRFSELHKCENADWHPGNPISQEKWIQVRLRWCKWSGADYEVSVKELSNLSYQDYWLYFVPAQQIVPLHESQPIKYKSQDRELEEGKIFEEAWAFRGAAAIANSYY